MKKNWKEQLLIVQEENLKLRLENQQLKDRIDEAREEARTSERINIARDILELNGRGK